MQVTPSVRSNLAQHPTFLEELMSAGRGVIGLLLGDRKAAAFFDASPRGLVTSFIALIIVIAIATYLPILITPNHDSALMALTQFAILFAAQLLCTLIVLRQIKRRDAFIPYLVADNWITFFVSLIGDALAAAGIGGAPITIVLGIAGLVLEVNLCRFVLALAPMQIALLIVAQAVGLLIAGGIILVIFPLPPDVLAQLNSLTQ